MSGQPLHIKKKTEGQTAVLTKQGSDMSGQPLL